MQIPVIHLDGKSTIVSEDELEELLRRGALKAFRRAEGWVHIGSDEIRNAEERSGLSWKDRKSIKNKGLLHS